LPSPGSPVEFRSSPAGSFLEIIVETLQPLDHFARAQFLRAFFRTLTHLDLSEEKSAQLWDEILLRQQTLSGTSGHAVSLQTALVDVFASSGLFHFPLLIERDDLKKIELHAVTDPLTGLHNRRLFEETFEKELNRARRYAYPLSLVTLDLDRFKEVNDQLGHPRGDDVLRAVASTLRKSLRTSDSAFRVGGDEFSLLLPQTDAPQAFALSKRISVIFAEVLQTLQISIPVNMDHGIATYSADGETPEQLVHVADQRLYQLKHANHSNSIAGPAPAKKTELSQQPVVSPAPSLAEAPAGHTPPSEIFPVEPTKSEKPSPIEMPRPAQPSESSLAAAVSAAAVTTLPSPSGATSGIQSRPVFAIQRKAERVSMTGTNAYAVLGEASSRRAKVLDLGFGGVALELDSDQSLPDNFLAILHVPILPPVRVNLRPVWSRPTQEGSLRVGCCFVS
jgi:diguanylate cyclase (GGDEF)-like protein